MEMKRSRSPILANHKPRSTTSNLKNSAKYDFRIQSAPPLSLKQFLRTSVGVMDGAKQWKPTGPYRDKSPIPIGDGMLPTKRSAKGLTKESVDKPTWRVSGKYSDVNPIPLSSRTMRLKNSYTNIKDSNKHEFVWHPTGKIQHKPVPYFDPPSLRWSLQDLLRSMPELRPQTFHSSRSTLKSKKKEKTNEI